MTAAAMLVRTSRYTGAPVAECPRCGTVVAYWDDDDTRDGILYCDAPECVDSDEPDPRCDACGVSDADADGWCGECGSCDTHCPGCVAPCLSCGEPMPAVRGHLCDRCASSFGAGS
jgi:hypothetical protein